MGANTSKPGVAREGLYELLNVESGADAVDLKKAYHSKALELHPDRNINNVEEATAMFAKVQAAYDILTDPQERQWYDQHRRSANYSQYNGHITAVTDIRSAVMEILSKNRIDYELVSSYFMKLKHEEQEAAFEQGVEIPASILFAPAFGSAEDKWTKVKSFYDGWSTFSTVKNYSWGDIYPIHAAQDRKTRRKYEQANQKVRDAAKREFDAAVKQAVMLLKNRDLRVPGEFHKDRSKQYQLIAKERVKRSEHVRQLRSSYEDQEWQKPEISEPYLGAQMQSLSTFAESGAHECIVCEVIFENEFDLEDHNNTNKHKKVVSAMKVQLLQEDELLNGVHQTAERQPPQVLKPGKAKVKAKKKLQSQHMLTCGTCGLELPGPELIAHKKLSRHP